MEIHRYPDPVLKRTADPVTEMDKDLLDLADHMLEVMYRAPGIGLAANQVGVLKRLIVFDLEPGKDRRSPCVLFNPEIEQREGEIVQEEACLSVVDFSAEVARNARVRVRGLDRTGKIIHVDAEDLLAVCLQHEIDHLDGTLYIDRISSLKRALYKKRLKRRLMSG